jgi:hypothetical protein
MVVLCLLFAGLVLFEIYRPKPVDWSQTLSNRDKIPYGTYILYSMMDTLFPGREVVVSRLPAYNCMEKDSALQASYIAISDAFVFDENDMRALLGFAAAGNSVFIASQYMHSPVLFDTLHIRVKDTLALRDSLQVSTSFTNPQLGDRKYNFQRFFQNTAFFEFDSLTASAVVLGRNSLGGPDFIKAGFGEGAFYLHLQPLAFSNYCLLNDSTSDYAFKALSYLPSGKKVIWDEYIKQGRVGEKSIMRVVMDKTALRWAYYITIFGILLFVVFEGKRRQRIIPVIKPLQNTTLEFVSVVSRLYFQKQDHHGIARKKIIFFLEHIRTQYHLPTNKLDEAFAETLSHKSGYPLEKAKYLTWKIRQTEDAGNRTAEDLLKLNGQIEDFYAETKK